MEVRFKEALTPRSFQHWNRSIGFGNRVEIQAVQLAKYPLRAMDAVIPGNNPRLEKLTSRLEKVIIRLQINPYQYSEEFNEALRRTSRSMNLAFYAIASVSMGFTYVHHLYEGLDLDTHDVFALGIPATAILVVGHYMKNLLLAKDTLTCQRDSIRRENNDQLIESNQALMGANAKLQKLQETCRQLFDDAPVAFHNVDCDGKILDVNKKWLKVMGYAKAEVVGKYIFDFIVDAQQENARLRFNERLTCGDPKTEKVGDRLYVTKDGKRIPVETHDSIIVSDGGSKFVQTSFEDLSAHRENERLMQIQAETEFQHNIFLWITHHLNSLITGIDGYNEMLKISNVNKDGNEAKRMGYLTKLQFSIERLKTFVSAFSVGGGKSENIDVGVCILEIFNRVHDKKENKTIVTELEIENDLKEINIFKTFFVQVIERLLLYVFDSAKKANKGKVFLKISNRTMDEREGVLISVYNNGGALAPEEQKALFRRFHGTTTNSQNLMSEETLFKVAQFAFSHGGRHIIESEEDATTIKIWIPYKRELSDNPVNNM